MDQLLNVGLILDIRLAKLKVQTESGILRAIHLEFDRVSSKSLIDDKALLGKVGIYLHDLINSDNESEDSNDDGSENE